MRSYTIMPATGSVELTGDKNAAQWAKANELEIDIYPWYTSGDKQATTVRILYDNEAIYLQFNCQDKHIFAEVTELNGNVCRDSCVEFFASYNPDEYPDYFNIEVNCCGTFLVGHGASRRPRAAITPELAAKIDVVTSEPGQTRQPKADDKLWWAAARVPYDVISAMAGREIKAPVTGDKWRGTCFRCGGNIDPQHASWSGFDTAKHPRPDFHQPDEFAEMIFG